MKPRFSSRPRPTRLALSLFCSFTLTQAVHAQWTGTGAGGAGTDFNTAGNWIGGTINGSFLNNTTTASAALSGDQIITGAGLTFFSNTNSVRPTVMMLDGTPGGSLELLTINGDVTLNKNVALNQGQTTASAWTSGATTITVSSTNNLAVGQIITGTSIASGTTITGISGNTVTLSAGTTANGGGSGVALTASSAGTWSSGVNTITVSSGADFKIGQIITAGNNLVSNNGSLRITAISGNALTLSGNTAAAQSTAAAISAVPSATFSSGSSTITVNDAVGLAVGQAVSGGNIVPGSVITAISGTVVTLSNPTYGASTNSAITIGSAALLGSNMELALGSVSRTFVANAGNGTTSGAITVNSKITGSGGITINGGSLNLTNSANSFSGDVTSGGSGTVNYTSVGALGSGNLGVSNSALAYNGSTAAIVTKNLSNTNNGNFNNNSSGGATSTLTLDGNISLGTGGGFQRNLTLGGLNTAALNEIKGVISGGGGIAVGSGVSGVNTGSSWKISGTSNSYTGGTSVSGTLEISSIKNIGGGNSSVGVALANGTLTSGSNIMSVTSTTGYVVGQTIVVTNSTNNGTIINATVTSVNNDNTVTLSANASAAGTFSNSVISMGGSSGSNLRYVGSGDTSDRQIGISDSGSSNNVTVTANGVAGGANTGALVLTGGMIYNGVGQADKSRNFFLDGTNTAENAIGNITFNFSRASGGANGNATVTKNGTGLWVMNGTNSYNVLAGGQAVGTYTTTVNNGILRLGSSGALPVASRLSISGGVLELGAGNFTRDSATSAADGNVQIASGGFSAHGGNRSVNLGGASATKTWGTNGFMTAGGGVFQLSSASSDSTVDFQNPLILGTTGTNTRTVQVNNGTAGVDAIMSGNLTSSGGTQALTKTGDGTLSLTGTNNYNGITTVSAGTLLINGDQSSATGNISVSATARLGGTGTVGGNTSITGTAIHSPGNSVGRQTFDATGAATTNLTYSSGSIFEWELASVPAATTITDNVNYASNRGTDYDAVNVTGTLGGSDAIFRVVLQGTQGFTGGFWAQNQTWSDIFRNGDGTGTSNLSFADIFSGGFQYYNYSGEGGTLASITTPTSGSFSITGSSLNWTAVPEPTSALAGLLITAGLLRRRRVG